MPNAYGLLHCNNCSCFSKCHQKIWTPLSNLLLRELICSDSFVLILICIFLNQQQMFLSLQGQHALKLLRTSRIYQNSVHFSWGCVLIIYLFHHFNLYLRMYANDLIFIGLSRFCNVFPSFNFHLRMCLNYPMLRGLDLFNFCIYEFILIVNDLILKVLLKCQIFLLHF